MLELEERARLAAELEQREQERLRHQEQLRAEAEARVREAEAQAASNKAAESSKVAAQDGELVGRRALCAKLEGELMRLKQGRGGGGGESGMVTPTTGGSSSARPFSSPVHDASAARRTRPPRMRF